ncbi:MAG: hypothetical protein GY769_03970, partial [bacterium]|nr:hypothetical protein [bacterium]
MRNLRYLASVLIVVGGATAGDATVRYVKHPGTDAGACTSSSAPCHTIGYAVSQSLSGDTIRVHDGFYSETLQVLTGIDLTIEGGWTASFGWRNLDPAGTRIDPDDSGTAIVVQPATGSAHVRLESLTIRDGTASGSPYGGGVSVRALTAAATAKVTLDHVVLRENHAGTGGGAAV